MVSDPVSRRAALALGGGAGLLGFLADKTGVARRPSTPALVGGSTEVAGHAPVPDAPWSLKSLLRRQERLRERMYLARIDGLEPSVACLKSVSPAIRAIIQRHRDLEAHTLLDELSAKIYNRELGSSSPLPRSWF